MSTSELTAGELKAKERELKKYEKAMEAAALEKGRMQGKLEQGFETLKALGYDDLETAKKKREELYERQAAAVERFNKLSEVWNEKYANFIE